jgi:hypothetical protein
MKDQSSRMEKKWAVVSGIITVLCLFQKFKGEAGMYAFIVMKNSIPKVEKSD